MQSNHTAFVACAALLARFYRLLDNGEIDEALKLMVPDAKWLRRGVPLVGQTQIKSMLADRPADSRTVHVLANLFMDDERGEEPSIVGRVVVFRQDNVHVGTVPSTPTPNTIGNIEATFRREGSAWLISCLNRSDVFRGRSDSVASYTYDG